MKGSLLLLLFFYCCITLIPCHARTLATLLAANCCGMLTEMCSRVCRHWFCCNFLFISIFGICFSFLILGVQQTGVTFNFWPENTWNWCMRSASGGETLLEARNCVNYISIRKSFHWHYCELVLPTIRCGLFCEYLSLHDFRRVLGKKTKYI